MTEPICSICGRGGKLERGWCGTHYSRWRKHGDPRADVPVVPRAKAGESRSWLEALLLVTERLEIAECVEWPFGTRGNGYAGIRYAAASNRTVHRLVCERVHGPCPPGREAAHACGNRACVNPLHLRWATPVENAADKLVHGTTARGERHGGHKLSAVDVLAIRASTLRPSELARRYGVTMTAITGIRRRKRWSWLLEESA